MEILHVRETEDFYGPDDNGVVGSMVEALKALPMNVDKGLV